LIKPLEKREAVFKPDRELILKGLGKGYLILLDNKCEKKLEELTDIYLNTVTLVEQDYIKKLMYYCKMDKLFSTLIL
jgi:hypothetical protein